ncbi:Hepatocyte growth factor-like protein [Seminavis robusta]|uniref:Hepatocyte growth factor-like protein n=1 Tax=Seminavis robusta TaxID=568900 RepID=A0A9N8EWI9_9STRA|nr:Hepatocyte growth factor-like protein [Seminavis robusta]|eukprot:Sro2034_g312010.1 Hepatocyte growth factor-like protein (546) ;mRNA; r:13378-15359
MTFAPAVPTLVVLAAVALLVLVDVGTAATTEGSSLLRGDPHRHASDEHHGGGGAVVTSGAIAKEEEATTANEALENQRQLEGDPLLSSVSQAQDRDLASNDDGASYRGTVHKTKTGKNCQRWDKQSPHAHFHSAEEYPESGLEENFCRNPNGDTGPWCYTTDPEELRGYCTVDGTDYRGNVHQTKEGIECQSWSVQSPHEHPHNPESFPQSGLEKNYCRNPDGDSGPWCYTTNLEIAWQYCTVPPSSYYLVVAYGRVRGGKYTDIRKAKAELAKGTGKQHGTRLIVEVQNGTVLSDPHTVAGQSQVWANGFHKWWRDENDIRRMIKIAQEYLKTEAAEEADEKAQQESEEETGSSWGAAASYKKKDSGCNDNGTLEYMDRHKLDCGANYAMADWHLVRCGDNDRFHIKYGCRAIPDGATVDTHRTTCQEGEERNIEYLDRHNVACPHSNQVLQQWHFRSHLCPGIGANIEFKCATLPAGKKVQNCQSYNTGCNDIHGRKIIYLDRHKLTCPAGKYMKQWTMDPSGYCGSGRSQFQYTCCDVVVTP